MKHAVLVLVMVIAGAIAGGSAWARGGHRGGHYAGHYRGYHGRSGLGLYFKIPSLWYNYYGLSFYTPYYYGYPYSAWPPNYGQSYYPAPAAAPAPTPAYWYYCAESRSYYPYVRECPGGWQEVAPQPPLGQ